MDGPTGNPIELTHGTKRLSYLDIPGAGQVYVDLGKLAEADLVHNGAFGKMHHDGGPVGHGDHPVPDRIGDTQLFRHLYDILATCRHIIDNGVRRQNGRLEYLRRQNIRFRRPFPDNQTSLHRA